MQEPNFNINESCSYEEGAENSTPSFGKALGMLAGGALVAGAATQVGIMVGTDGYNKGKEWWNKD